jgi:hypothetical protein
MESNDTNNVYTHIDFDITLSQTDTFLKFFIYLLIDLSANPALISLILREPAWLNGLSVGG